MPKQSYRRALSLALLTVLLVGGGCANYVEQTPNGSADRNTPSKMMNDDTQDDAMTSDDAMMDDASDSMMMRSGDVTLSAEALGDGRVALSWKSDVAMGEDDRFVLVRSDEANPENDGVNYWWKQYYTVREATWIDLEPGTQHFRLCVLKDDTCAMYSNDVMVEVE